MARDKTFTIAVKDGGHLNDTDLPENVGPANYTMKLNWRRVNDAEVRREGAVLFRPNLSLPLTRTEDFRTYAQCFNANPIAPPPFGVPPSNWDDRVLVGIWECVRGNGDRDLVAVSKQGVIYRFSHVIGDWQSISGAFTGATEWEAVSIDGYLILNNRIDLPIWVRVEDNMVGFVSEMRQVGIACVGTIAVYNGFLMVADITEFKRPTNPFTQDTFVTWMNGSSPYARPPANIVQRIKYKIAWSDYGKPLNWSPFIPGTISADSKNKVTVDWGMNAHASTDGTWGIGGPPIFPVGAKIAISGAGPNGGMLGGQVGTDDGVAVAAKDGNVLTLQSGVTADASLSYPLRVMVSRFADLSTFVGSSSIKDDSSAVTAMKPLKRGLVVYRETGIFSGRYTGVVETPFVFQPEYGGRNVPVDARAIAEVNGDYHVYPSTDRFYYFDGTGEPRLHTPLDKARGLFFKFPNGKTLLSPEVRSRVFALQNPITQEVWFCAPHTTLAFDYLTVTENNIPGTCSYMSRTWRAGCFAHPVADGDNWFVLTDPAGQVWQYGALESGPFIFEPVSQFECGRFGFKDDANLKTLLDYIPMFEGNSELPVRVLFFATSSSAPSSISAEPPFVCEVRLDKPISYPAIYTSHSGVYFYELVGLAPTSVTPDTTTQMRYFGRSYHFLGTRTQGFTRHDAKSGDVYPYDYGHLPPI